MIIMNANLVYYNNPNSLSLSHTHTHTHTHTLSLSLSLSHTHTHTLSLSLYHYFFFSLALSPSLSLYIYITELSSLFHLYYHQTKCLGWWSYKWWTDSQQLLLTLCLRNCNYTYTYLTTPLLGQDMTQGRFLSGV